MAAHLKKALMDAEVARHAGRTAYRDFTMGKNFHRMLVIAVLLATSLAGGAWIYAQHPKFGKLPDGARLDTIKLSPHYSGAGFQNLIPTPMLAEDRSFVSELIGYLLVKNDHLVPTSPIPSVKTDLQSLDRNMDVVVWLGHSSYFVQLGGKRILIDPVFSVSAAPVPHVNKAFDGTNPYTAEDVPEIDYLLITHDHWDHLDYSTVTALRARTKTVVSGLSVGAHIELWGYDKHQIHEADWFSVLESGDGFAIHVLPARHYSGRLLTRNKTLWAGYALTTARRRIFVSGDSGYGPHFADVGRRFGGFDLVVLDTGQYDERWPYIHMTPEEAARAAQDLQANALLPGHVGKFSLARHSWDDPFWRITAASEGRSYRLLTPMIGSPIVLDDQQQRFSRWWEDPQP
jgi:L-ascorbate metabolism protein UlaG (beta-lactamase superfamily)